MGGNQVWTYTWDARVRIWDRKSRDYLGSLCSYHSQPISSVVSNWEDNNDPEEEWDTASVSYDHSLVLWRCRNLLQAKGQEYVLQLLFLRDIFHNKQIAG